MNKTIKELENDLLWPLEIRENSEGLCETSCDPSEKKHIFFLPQGESRNSTTFARCLCHAWLAEKIHPLFSAVVVEGPESVPESVFENQIWPVFCVSRLWFADALMTDRFPEESKKEIQKKLDVIDHSFPDGQIRADLSNTLQVALTLAEAKYFWQINRNLQGSIKEMTHIFMQIDPGNPGLDYLKELNHDLLYRYSTFSAEIVYNNEIGEKVWRIF